MIQPQFFSYALFRMTHLFSKQFNMIRLGHEDHRQGSKQGMLLALRIGRVWTRV